MPTTFNVISLGVLADIDTVEGDETSENADALLGLTFGGPGDALVNYFQSFSPGTPSYSSDGNDYYDHNDNSEGFSLDGGASQAYDGGAVYHATITYVNGDTADITAVIFQDVNGNTYLAPEINNNNDQRDLEAAPIQSLTLNSVQRDGGSGLQASRETWDYVPCFTAGTMIATAHGPRRVDSLQVGDLVRTQDNGVQPIRWVGRRQVTRAHLRETPKLAPVCIFAGSLGKGLPKRDMWVSRQHRMLVSSPIAKRMFDTPEVLVAAVQLTTMPGIFVDGMVDQVEYYHLLFDRHEVIFAEGAPTESLLGGAEAMRMIGSEARKELEELCPEAAELDMPAKPARHLPSGREQKQLMERHAKNKQPVLFNYDCPNSSHRKRQRTGKVSKSMPLYGAPNPLAVEPRANSR